MGWGVFPPCLYHCGRLPRGPPLSMSDAQRGDCTLPACPGSRGVAAALFLARLWSGAGREDAVGHASWRALQRVAAPRRLKHSFAPSYGRAVGRPLLQA